MVMSLELQVDPKKVKDESQASSEIRNQLIEMVSQNGLSIYHASTVLNIRYSVAKVIIRRYRSQHARPRKPKIHKPHKRQTSPKLTPRPKEKMIQAPYHAHPLERKELVPQRKQEGVQDKVANLLYFVNYYFDPLTVLTLYSTQTSYPTTNETC